MANASSMNKESLNKIKKIVKGPVLIALIIGIVLGAAGGIFYSYTQSSKETNYSLNGNQYINIDLGAEYIDEGITLTYHGKEITMDKINVYNNVNANIEGTYLVTYEFVNGNDKITLSRIVNVIGVED